MDHPCVICRRLAKHDAEPGARHETDKGKSDLPGLVVTELWDWMPKEQLGAFMEEAKRGMTTGEVGRPEDVAEAYLYCMRDRNVTGSLIGTNGGALLMTGKF